jgi:hypothetical protein
MKNYSSDNQVKLPFGLRRNGELAHISTVLSGLACECYCAACGTRLMAKKGEKNTHHFAHYQAEECEHALETVLHLAAKKILEESSEIILPELIIYEEVSGEICGQSRIKKGEAIVCEQHIAHIDNVILEKHLTSIVPDVIAYIDGIPLIIEIAVTHFVDEDKQNKINDLWISCIEIDLSDVFIAANLDAIRSIVVDSVAEKVWLLHTEEARVRAELKANLDTELQSELEQIYQQEQEYQRQQNELRRIKLEQEENARQAIQPELRSMNDYLEEIDRRHSEFAQTLSSFSVWERASISMGVSPKTLPDFLNYPVKGEDIFACDRRVWQAGLFSVFIHKKIQKYGEPYPISIDAMIKWCKKNVKLHLFALTLFSNKELLNAEMLDSLQNFDRSKAINEFVKHLERKGFIKYHYYPDKYKIISDTLPINDTSDDTLIHTLSVDEYECFQERAAIHEFCGGLTRKEAEKLAYASLSNN